MLGRVLNTHQQWLCRKLADLGYVVSRQVAVPDRGAEIEQAVREALQRAELIITTGGLGPTSDDITRDLIAQLVGKKLQEDANVLAHIRSFFEARKRPMPERTAVQALVPEGAEVLPNPNGTAPGLAMEVRSNAFREAGKGSWLVMLPGPPRELRPMFNDAVEPLLRRVFPPEEAFVCRTFRTTGVGESIAQEKIGKQMEPLVESGLDLGVLRKTRAGRHSGGGARQSRRRACATSRKNYSDATGVTHFWDRQSGTGGRDSSFVDRAEADIGAGRIVHRRLHRSSNYECGWSIGRVIGRTGDLQ